MTSQPSACPDCGQPGRWGSDDDWCHDTTEAALGCSREGQVFDALPAADDEPP